MSGLEERILTLIKDLEEEKRLADKRAKQLYLAGGAGTFLSLTDTPADYSAQAGKFVKVNAVPDALVFADIAWADVLKAGSNLTDLATRLHSSLHSIGADDHHPQVHTHASHTSIGANDHHPQLHASAHLVGGADPLSVGVPVSIGIALLEGTATNLARRDHVHTHPDGLGVNRHHPQLHAAEHEIGGAGDLVHHDNLSGFVVSEHTSLPNTIAAVLSNHTQAVHNALNIDADTLDTLHAASFALTTRKLDDFGTPDDNTDLNATTTRHGLLLKLSGVTANFLRGDGTWANPVLGVHASSHEMGGGDLVHHNDLVDYAANVHQVLPNTIAVVLSDHNVANHNSLSIDHGSLGGRTDDDHSIYYNATRHTKAIHDSLALDHGFLGGRGDDDHSIYYNAARHTVAIHDSLNINADRLDGYHGASLSTANTYARRDASGDIHARLFRSEYDSLNATCNIFMTQIDTVSNNYIRPSTKAQVIASLRAQAWAFSGMVTARDHGLASVDEVVNVCFGTGNPPAADTTTHGSLFVKYTA